MSTAAGLFASMACASAFAIAGTPCAAKSSDSITSALAIGPDVRAPARAAPFPAGARTTAVTSPMRAAAVASSAVVLVALSPEKSARINTLLISTSFQTGKSPEIFRPLLHRSPFHQLRAVGVELHR